MVASKMGVTMFNPTVAAAVPYAAPEPIVVNTTTTAPLAWTMTVRSKCGDVVRTLAGQQEAGGGALGRLGQAQRRRASRCRRARTRSPSPAPAARRRLPVDRHRPRAAHRGLARRPVRAADRVHAHRAPASATASGCPSGAPTAWPRRASTPPASSPTTTRARRSRRCRTTWTPASTCSTRCPSARMRAEALDPSGGAIEVTVGPTVTVGGPARRVPLHHEGRCRRRAARGGRPDRRPRHRPDRHGPLGRHPHPGHGGRRADAAQRRRSRLVPRLVRASLPLRHRRGRPGVDVERRAAERRQLGARPRRVPVRHLRGLELVADGRACRRRRWRRAPTR